MPTVTFYMTDGYTERTEDVLTFQAEKGKKFADPSEWERSVVREYINAFIDVYRKWEATGLLMSPVTRQEEKVRLAYGKDEVPFDMKRAGERPVKRVLAVGGATLEWMSRAMQFWAAAEKHFNRALPKGAPALQFQDARAKSVGELISVLLDLESAKALAELDKRKLDEETKEATAAKPPVPKAKTKAP